jgi:hypothetical protein
MIMFGSLMPSHSIARRDPRSATQPNLTEPGAGWIFRPGRRNGAQPNKETPGEEQIGSLPPTPNGEEATNLHYAATAITK